MHVTGYCDLSAFSGPLPSQFQYFPQPNVGGHIQIADFCPRVNEWTNGDCTNPDNQNPGDPPQGIQHGSDSRCFFTTLLSKMYVPDNTKNPGPGCYKRTCK